MHLFEYPYIILTILVICFAFLALGGVYFALRGIKTANGKEKKDFLHLSKLEADFLKSSKLRLDRCVLYIGLSFDNFESIYSQTQTTDIFLEIKKILLEAFSDGENSLISINSEKNFIVFTKWNEQDVREKIDISFKELNKCLLKHSALNVIDIRIGAYFAHGSEVTFDEAISRAKQAYILSDNEKIPYAEWNLSEGKALEKKIKIENNIEKEIDNNRFFLEYQPVLDAKTKKIIGAEVLSRLNSESDGVLTPGSFLSAMDSVGIHDKFDYYIFEKNCKWISNDKSKRESYKYTINFSRSTLCEPEFAENIIKITEKYNLDFSCLAIEILEDKNITGDARAQMIENLSLLKKKGMSILLDDFGSGYTTFGDLQHLDISIVKIDKEISQNAITDTGFIILKNIISTAHDIGFKTLCEGVETQEHEDAVIKAGCDFLQGYYYYKPMPVAQLEKVFNEN